MRSHTTLIKIFPAYIILLLSVINIFGQSVPASNAMYNQVAYATNLPKILLVKNNVQLCEIYDMQDKKVLSIKPEAPKYWHLSGDTVRKVDFSDITQPGIYTIVLPDVNEKFQIKIADKPYHTITKAVLKAFYFNRSGMPVTPEFGGQWARPAGHPDTRVYIHASAADGNRPAGSIISSPLGWYDAGDYNKYIVNSGISTYTLLQALTDFPDYLKKTDSQIPESGSGVPDILSETMFNLKWMLSMQDPSDGGVYHKLTNKHFDGSIMPHAATNERFVVSKTTAAALNFAAVTAKASVLLKDYEADFPFLSDECLIRAEKAWDWAVKNPDIPYIQPADIHTGAYGDDQFDDEFFWAASELYLATGKSSYLTRIEELYKKPVVPSWQSVNALGFISLLNNYDNLPLIIRQKGLKKDFLALADELTDISMSAPYGVSIKAFVWGSNSTVANEGLLKIAAYKLTSNEIYLHAALSDLDYIFGRNATGFCFVTGFGHKKVMNIHHRPSEADGISDPVPGFLAGGPNTDLLTDCPPEVLRSLFPAKSYVDEQCSYSTNEVAINWNAPLVYLLAGINTVLENQKY